MIEGLHNQEHPPTVGGQRLNIWSMGQLIAKIFGKLDGKKSFYICTLNLDHLVKLQDDEQFREAYRQAAFITADGAPIVALLRLKKTVVSRVTGADAVLPICVSAAKKNRSIFLIGASDQILNKSVAALTRQIPSLKIAGRVAPSKNFQPESREAEAIVQSLNQTDATICLVGLGAPKQEIFSLYATGRTEGIAFIPVGAALEFIAGEKARAPAIFQRTGLEWFWRLLHEPRRLGRRYLMSGIIFFKILYNEIVFSREKSV